MAQRTTPELQFAPGGEQLLLRVGLRPDAIFSDPRIRVWRDLPERQNCTLDPAAGETFARLHIKRYKAPHGRDAMTEAQAVRLLGDADILSVPLVAAGRNADGTGFLISADLSGLIAADRALQTAADTALPEHIADLAIRLHRARLHHRDLYLCHFFTNPTDPDAPLHLIDPGRVARMPAWPLHYRWIVKDLAQLLFSIADAQLPAELRDRIFFHYLDACMPMTRLVLRAFVPLKIAAIARHDRKARQKRPSRRVSLDGP